MARTSANRESVLIEKPRKGTGERAHQRHGDGDERDERRPPVLQEEEDDEDDQERRLHEGDDDLLILP
jgi:hypothetical protein